MKNSIFQIIRVLEKLNYILNCRQKKKAILVLLIILIGAGFELIGVTAILPFVQAVMEPKVLVENAIVSKLMQMLSIKSANGLLLFMGVMLICLYLVKNAFMIFSQYIQAWYATRIQKDLSVQMLKAYMDRPYTFFLDTNSSEVIRGVSSDTSSVYSILSYLLTIFAELLTILMIGIFIVITDATIAISVLTLMIIVLLGIVLLFKPKMKKAGLDNVKAVTEKEKAIYQCITGIKEIFVMQRKSLFVNEYEKASEISRRAQCVYDTLNNSPDRIVEGICVSGIIGIVCVRLIMNDASNISFIPKLGAFAMAAFKIFPSIGKLANRINGMVYHLPGLDNVYENMLQAELYEIKQRQYIERYGSQKLLLIENQNVCFVDKLEVKHILWQYDKAKIPVLTDASITIHKGEAVALIGASGAGKTTLADIILGLMQPQQGSVIMDGIDVYTILEEWAHIVGYVPQSIFLIDDTVRNNIAFGLPKEQVTDEAIWDALERAQLASFIRSLPQKLDTIVGERGVKFSGGQRQRIAIARALYNKPQILVLDEATAALDNETENAVMESIDALQGQITMIIVAHRLTTIRNCDIIYEIKNGKATVRSKEEVLGEA